MIIRILTIALTSIPISSRIRISRKLRNKADNIRKKPSPMPNAPCVKRDKASSRHPGRNPISLRISMMLVTEAPACRYGYKKQGMPVNNARINKRTGTDFFLRSQAAAARKNRT